MEAELTNFPVFPPDTLPWVAKAYELRRRDRLAAAEEAAAEAHDDGEGTSQLELAVGQFVIKTVTDCNMRCEGKGYRCYEYVDDSWRDLPPKMSDETMHQLGTRMGTYAKQEKLKRIGAVFHGGEPLYTPGEPPEKYYARIIPILRAAVAEAAPGLTLNLSMHTNGTRLRERILDVLSEHNVGVSVSLDGPAEAHNRNRVVQHNGQRIGMFLQTERGLNLLRSKYRHLFRGILAVVDVENDPHKVLETLASFEPPRIDFLWPYASWDELPSGLDIPIRELNTIKALQAYRRQTGNALLTRSAQQAVVRRNVIDYLNMPTALQLADYASAPGTEEHAYAVPYANWMLKVFEANQKRNPPVNIRIFKSIESLAMGGSSFTEAIGPMAGGEVIVRTDGSIEFPDSLKAMHAGLEKMRLNVTEEGGLESAVKIMNESGYVGRKSVADDCRSCDLLAICGGGHIATRYSQENGFNNPSVYCADLTDLIERVRDAVITPQQEIMATVLAKVPHAQLPPPEAKPDIMQARPPRRQPDKFFPNYGPGKWEVM